MLELRQRLGVGRRKVTRMQSLEQDGEKGWEVGRRKVTRMQSWEQDGDKDGELGEGR